MIDLCKMASLLVVILVVVGVVHASLPMAFLCIGLLSVELKVTF